MPGTVISYLAYIVSRALILMIVTAAVVDSYLFFKEVPKVKHPACFTAVSLAAALALKVVI